MLKRLQLRPYRETAPGNYIKALIMVGSIKLHATATSVKMVATTSAIIRGLSSHASAVREAQLHSRRRCRRTMNQLAATATTENAVIGQRSEPKDDSAVLNPALSPTPASAIGRIQHEHAASTAPTLLIMLTNVVLPSLLRSGAAA